MKTYEEINKKIKNKEAVVLTAEEVIDVVRKKGAERAAEEVDVVTTGTFGAMCSSGAVLNFGHADPPIRMADITLNDVPAYGGLAAVDTYIGATQINNVGKLGYGGAHVIEELVSGKKVRLKASGPGSDCYIRKSIKTHITLDSINEAYLFNTRNAYQNYAVATNSSDKTLQTYMGKLLPNLKNATYCSAGQLSPLVNDPHTETIGIGTKIFLGGGEGYVAWGGTQYKTDAEEVNGIPVSPSRTVALIGDLKQMTREYVRGLHLYGYGTSLGLGVGVPIPILNADIIQRCAISDDQIFANVLDYAVTSRVRPPLKKVSYAELKSGEIEYNGNKIRTSALSSYRKARKIANELKGWIENGEFELTVPVKKLPKESKFKPLAGK